MLRLEGLILAGNLSAASAITRLFRVDRHREVFRILADSLEEAVVVVSDNGTEILTANHAFLLLTGYARNELEMLTLGDLFAGEPGDQVFERVLATQDRSELNLDEVPLQTREGSICLVDLQALSTGPSSSLILLKMRPSSLRHQREEKSLVQQKRMAILAEVSSSILDGTVKALPLVLNLAVELLFASHVGVYRVSAKKPEYVRDGPLPDTFPESLPSTDLDPLNRPTLWSIGTRPEHPLHKAARSAGLSALRTAMLGTTTAWVGLLVVGWEHAEDMPEDVVALMEVVANLCHAAILLGLQRAAVADLEVSLHTVGSESRSQFEAISEALLLLSPNLIVERANTSASKMFGYPRREMEGLPVQDVLVGSPDVMSTLLDVSGHQRPAERNRITLHRRDGTPFPVSLRALPLIAAQDSRVLVILQDLSERQAIEDQTEILAQRALLGEVTAIFAHEVRNPINNISTGLQLIASRLGKEHNLYETLDRVRNECTRLDRLMEDVLFFARPLELKMKPLDLADFVDRILDRWAPRFNQAGVHCHKEYHENTPLASADPRTLEQVIVNVITNAVEAMPNGGSISVKLLPAPSHQGKTVELKIADTGPGIRPDQIDRVFDPFYTTKKTGTGLGLAISRRIMMAHCGGIQVQSFADAGTVFTISIPIAKEQGEEA